MYNLNDDNYQGQVFDRPKKIAVDPLVTAKKKQKTAFFTNS